MAEAKIIKEDVLGKYLNYLKMLLVAVVVFLTGTQILINAVPYSRIVNSINSFSKQVSTSIVDSLQVDITENPNTGTAGGQVQSLQTLLLAGIISTIINIIVVAVIAGIQVILIASVVIAIIGTLALSQNRGLFETFGLMFGFFLPRQRKHWGFIFDQETNLPIAFTTVRLNQATSGNQSTLVSQTVTDLDGRYRLYLPARSSEGFAISVKSPGYKDVIRAITKVENSEVIEDVGMSKIDNVKRSRLNEWIDNQRADLSQRFSNYLTLLSVGGFAISLYSFIEFNNYLWLFGVVIYGLSSVWNLVIVNQRRNTNIGRIIDGDVSDNANLEGVFVKVYYNGQALLSGITDKQGVVKLNVEKGTYQLEVTRQGYQLAMPGMKDGRFIDAYINDKGYLTKNVVMAKDQKPTKDNPGPQKVVSSMMNPFA